MRRLYKWSLRSIAAVIVLLALIAVAVAVIMNTQAGTRWALIRIQSELPGELVLAEFTGTFWSGLQFSSINYRDEEREFSISNASLAVNWRGVAAGRIALRDLHADTVHIRNLVEADTGAEPLTLKLPVLGIHVTVRRASVGTLTLPGGDTGRQFDNLLLRNAVLDGEDISVERFAAAILGIEFEATQVSLKLDDDLSTAAQVEWMLADGGWSGQGDVHGSLAALSFEQNIRGAYPMTTAGTIKLLHLVEPEFDITIAWDDWVLTEYQFLNGKVRIRGIADNYSANYDSHITIPSGHQLHVAGSAAANLRQLTAFAAKVGSEFGYVDVQAQVQEFNVDENGVSMLTDLTADGLFRDSRMTASGELSLAPQHIGCKGCALALGDNQLRASGQLTGDKIDFDVAVDAPYASQILASHVGSLHGSGSIGGSVKQPTFAGEMRAEQLRYDAWTAATFVIDSRDSRLDNIDIRVEVSGLQHELTDYGSFTAHGVGSRSRLRLQTSWQVFDLQIDAQGNLQASSDIYAGGIEKATIQEPRTGLWELQDGLTFRIADDEVFVSPHLWSGESGHLRIARLDSTAGNMDIVANIEKFPLRFADAFMPAEFGLSGEATANINVERRAGLWSGLLDWRQTNTVLKVSAIDDVETNITIPRAELHAEFRDGGVVAKAGIEVDPSVNAELDLKLDRLDADARIDAEMRLRGEDLGWLSAVAPLLDGFDGTIEASIKAFGPFAAPEFSGDAVWRDGRLLLPAANVPLEEIQVVVSGASNGTATLQGSAKAGRGSLAVDGRFAELMQPGRSLTLDVTGVSAEIINWPEYRLWASPEIRVVGDADGWRVSGKLKVPRAEIEIRDLPVGSTTVSDDVVVLGAEPKPIETLPITGESELLLGDNVRFKALGLNTRLSGKLLVSVLANRETRAEGRISLVDGTYAAQGQELKIQKGELTFTGPLDDPIVDVRAVRVVDTLDDLVTVGIQLRGRAQNLTSSVFSDPPMSDGNALSYLILGRPLNQMSEDEGGELSGAAVSLGLQQATRFTEQLGQSVGLDQLSLTGDGGDTTSLIAGKQLNERLYVRYAYGVFSRLGTLLLRYRMSQRLTLEAGTSEAQSIDVLYSVDKQ